MTGLVIRFLQRFLILNLIIFSTILVVSYLKNVGQTAQHPILFWIIHYPEYITNYRAPLKSTFKVV